MTRAGQVERRGYDPGDALTFRGAARVFAVVGVALGLVWLVGSLFGQGWADLIPRLTFAAGLTWLGARYIRQPLGEDEAGGPAKRRLIRAMGVLIVVIAVGDGAIAVYRFLVAGSHGG
jgi:hypothetical protein